MEPTGGVLTPELCRTFAAVARLNGSVTAAARALGVSTASVSKRLRPLVAGSPPHLPRPWLAKAGRRFALTDEGRRMLPAAEEQAERWAGFVVTAAADAGRGVTVACGQETAGGVVLAAAARFRRRHPDVSVRVAVVRGRARIEGVASGRYHLALTSENPATVRERVGRPVAIDTLTDRELVLVAAARGRWADEFTDPARVVDAAEVGRWPLVLPDADAAVRRRWDELLRRRGAAVTPAIEVGGWRVLLGYVLAGFGVGLLPRAVAASAGARVKTRPLAANIRPTNRLQVVYLPGRPNRELTDAFRAELLADG